MKHQRTAVGLHLGCVLAVMFGWGSSLDVLADESDITTKFSGYGTLAATVTNNANADFRSSWAQGKGVGTDVDIGADSRLGLQGVTTFSPEFSVTGQILAERRRTDTSVASNQDFNLGVEWLYAQYNASPNLSFRLGRVALPAFMISDSRNVGYAQPWLRAPLDVYAGMPLTDLDGLQALWRINLGSAILTIQPSYGSATTNVSVGGATGPTVLDTTSKHVSSLNASLEWGDWTARFGQVRGTDPFNLYFFGPTEPAYADNLKDRFTSAGLQFDNGSALFMTEITQRREPNLPASAGATYNGVCLGVYLGTCVETGEQAYEANIGGKPLAKSEAWYIGGGWHFGKLLPMLVIGEFRDQLASKSYHSVDLSLRYDVVRNVALKAQISSYSGQDSNAFLNTLATPSHITVFAAGVDFVF